MFRWLSDIGGIDKFEMLKTFNCGIGMTIICSPSSQGRIFSSLEKLGENPIIIGQVTSSSKVEYSGNFV
ncbi:MAG: hypothetical protein CBD20_000005 [Rhodobacteraceae bacterium TMED160]|nr:MAG: hypothetical protein CBD20_000005 [Rhodobacteraceae bacterium TMED160]